MKWAQITLTLSRNKASTEQTKTELSKEEYDRIISNCFNVHGLPKAVYRAIASSVIKSVDELLSGQTKINKTLRNFVEREYQQRSKEGEDGTKKDYDQHFKRFEKSLTLLEKTMQSKVSSKTFEKNLDQKADVTSLQKLEEKYCRLGNEMVGNQFRAQLVFKVKHQLNTNSN